MLYIDFSRSQTCILWPLNFWHIRAKNRKLTVTKNRTNWQNFYIYFFGVSNSIDLKNAKSNKLFNVPYWKNFWILHVFLWDKLLIYFSKLISKGMTLKEGHLVCNLFTTFITKRPINFKNNLRQLIFYLEKEQDKVDNLDHLLCILRFKGRELLILHIPFKELQVWPLKDNSRTVKKTIEHMLKNIGRATTSLQSKWGTTSILLHQVYSKSLS